MNDGLNSVTYIVDAWHLILPGESAFHAVLKSKVTKGHMQNGKMSILGSGCFMTILESGGSFQYLQLLQLTLNTSKALFARPVGFGPDMAYSFPNMPVRVISSARVSSIQ